MKGKFWKETFEEFGLEMEPKELMGLQKKMFKRILFLLLSIWGILIFGNVMGVIFTDGEFAPMDEPMGYVMIIIFAFIGFSTLFIILNFIHEIFKRIAD
ncbi:MAG TPA: hypothetical protein EYG91_05090 [Aquifex aeolicus]|nr:hypothetical protein [Aquifex aeolicus]